MSAPVDREVWTASQYVDELRRRRDDERANAAVQRHPDAAAAAHLRADVYEECAALAELTADHRARGPVLDALALFHSKTRELAKVLRAPVERRGDHWEYAAQAAMEAVGLASDATDAALAARSALPEIVVAYETFGSPWCDHAMANICGTWEERQARRAGWERCSLVTRFCPPVHRTPECGS